MVMAEENRDKLLERHLLCSQVPYLQSISLLLQQLVSSLGSLLLTLEDLLIHTGGRDF